jgi:hypothetical protein
LEIEKVNRTNYKFKRDELRDLLKIAKTEKIIHIDDMNLDDSIIITTIKK